MRLIDIDDDRNCYIGFDGEYEKWNIDLDVLAEAKTVEPQRWIPVAKQLPKNDDWVIVTVLDESGDTLCLYTDFGWYLEAADCWIIGSEQRNDVIAWMPLPTPWKAGRR